MLGSLGVRICPEKLRCGLFGTDCTIPSSSAAAISCLSGVHFIQQAQHKTRGLSVGLAFERPLCAAAISCLSGVHFIQQAQHKTRGLSVGLAFERPLYLK